MNPQCVYKNIHCSFKEGINRTPRQCCKWQNVLVIWCILSVVNEDEETVLSCGGKSHPESSPPGQSCACSVTVRTETACTGSLCAQRRSENTRDDTQQSPSLQRVRKWPKWLSEDSQSLTRQWASDRVLVVTALSLCWVMHGENNTPQMLKQ